MKNIAIIFSFICSIAVGQNKFTVYFDTDSHQLTNTELNRLDTFLKNKELKIYQIVGFCDYRASNAYNDTLSQKRALFVRNLIEKLTNQTSVEISAKGKNFKQDANLALNRKVDIYYEEVLLENKEENKEEKVISVLAKQVATAKVGDKLILKNLYFYNRSGIIVPKSRPILEELLQILKTNPKLKIEIQGHICCQKGRDVEDTAKVRAMAVYHYLINNHIDKTRLSYKSFGSSRPIHTIPENNEDERNENRRVEIQILSN